LPRTSKIVILFDLELDAAHIFRLAPHANKARHMLLKELYHEFMIVYTSSILVLRAHFKNHAIPKYSYLLGILALNMFNYSHKFLSSP
jgi:hypothetical protein